MAKGQLKYRNPNYVEGGDEPKWISLGVSGGSSGGNGGSGDGGDVKQYETVNVSISADNGQSITADVTVNGETKIVTSGSSVPWEVEYGTEYSVSVGAVDGFATPKELNFTAGQSTRNVELVYNYLIKITTIRIDQNITDPATMITRIVDQGGIEAIRANSHRYTGTLNSEGIMELKQLDDNDGTKYVDGTDADLTTLGTDVWMKLPQFYWKCEEHETDVWDFSVAHGGRPDNSYKEWDGKDLIGVYEAYNSSNKVYSVSEQNSTGSVTQPNFKAYARARGTGFTLVKWKHHCMMAMLFYAQYGHTNSQLKIGIGADSYQKKTGITNAMGMGDTVGDGGNGDSSSINFFGLENWWGNKEEFIDNVECISDGSSEETWTITEDDGTTRTLNCIVFGNFLAKALFGNNIDLVPSGDTFGTDVTGYCDKVFTYSYTHSRAVRRSGAHGNTANGVAIFNTSGDLSSTALAWSSRLAFRGEYVIV